MLAIGGADQYCAKQGRLAIYLPTTSQWGQFQWTCASVTALVFDFTNGFHDTANAMATSIATSALRPRTAVAIAGCLNVAGAFLSVQVAKTIAGGLVDETLISPVVIFAGLIGAIVWNLVTWYFGIPSSSSHALIGGIIVMASEATHGTITHTLLVTPMRERVLLAKVVTAAGLGLAFGLIAEVVTTHDFGRRRTAVFR